MKWSLFMFLFVLLCKIQSQPSLNTITTKSSSGSSEDHGNDTCTESHYEMSQFDAATTVLVIISIIICLSLLFEWIKHLVEHNIPEEMEVVVHHFWSELCVLGFLSFTFFVLSQGKVVAIISEDVYGDSSIVKHLFEEVHMFFFICMIAFLFEVMGLFYIARVHFNQWKHLEKVTTEDPEAVVHGWWNATDVIGKRRGLIRLVFSVFPSFEPYRTEIITMQYLMIREHFVNPPHSDPLPKNFLFSEYLILNLAEKLTKIVDIHPLSWLSLEFVFVLSWFALITFDSFVVLQLYSFLGWIFLFVCWIYEFKVNYIQEKLLPDIPDGHEWSQTQAELLQEEYDDDDQELKELKTGITLLGATSKQAHYNLFWFSTKGEEFLTQSLNFMVLLGSIHSSIFVYGVAVESSDSWKTNELVFFSVITTVPMLFTAFIVIPSLIKRLVVVCSIEGMKKKHLIDKVLSLMKQKRTSKMVSVLRILKKKNEELKAGERRTRSLTNNRMTSIKSAYKTLSSNPHGDKAKRTTWKILNNLGIKSNENVFKLLDRFDSVLFLSYIIITFINNNNNNFKEEISYDEFQLEILNLIDDSEENLENMIQRLYQCLTHNSVQDSITLDQIYNMLSSVSEECLMSKDELFDFFDEVDHDHDGRISIDQFSTLIKKYSVL